MLHYREDGNMKKIVVLIMISLIFASCASVQKKDERSIFTVAELINQGDSGALFRMSRVPFLLDQEIILLKKDIETFWSNIIEAGYTVDSPVLEDGQAIGKDSYLRFYDSMEVKTFFKKYLPEKTRMLELKTSTNQRILLLVEKKWLTRKIYGFKGPY